MPLFTPVPREDAAKDESCADLSFNKILPLLNKMNFKQVVPPKEETSKNPACPLTTNTDEELQRMPFNNLKVRDLSRLMAIASEKRQSKTENSSTASKPIDAEHQASRP